MCLKLYRSAWWCTTVCLWPSSWDTTSRHGTASHYDVCRPTTNCIFRYFKLPRIARTPEKRNPALAGKNWNNDDWM